MKLKDYPSWLDLSSLTMAVNNIYIAERPRCRVHYSFCQK